MESAKEGEQSLDHRARDGGRCPGSPSPSPVHKAADGTLSEATLALSIYCLLNIDYHVLETVSLVSFEEEQR